MSIRYEKLSGKTTPLSDGKNPPAEMINPDYKQQPRNTRKCIECGNTHDTIVENTMTGEIIEELSKCKRCIICSNKNLIAQQLVPVFGQTLPGRLKKSCFWENF